MTDLSPATGLVGYNKQVHERIVAKMRAGAPLDLAAESCGIYRETARSWQRRGINGNPVLVQFAADTLAAHAETQLARVARIQDKAIASVEAKDDQWLLEREEKAVYSKQVTISSAVNEKLNKTMDAFAEHMSATAFAELVRAAAIVAGEAEDDEG